MATPKPDWSGTDLLEPLIRRFKAPVAIDTDVNAAAMAELRLGAGRDVRSIAYVTVGTGIGGGFAPAVWKGAQMLHPELGHLRVQRDPRDLDFSGICPFHGDCLEGLACGPAIRVRWGQEINSLTPDHPAWSIIGNYLGQLATSIALALSPERIVFGGGVMTGGCLLPLIRATTGELLKGYIGTLNAEGALDRYIASPGLGDRAGLAGAMLLAEEASI
jgi:fructokinase